MFFKDKRILKTCYRYQELCYEVTRAGHKMYHLGSRRNMNHISLAIQQNVKEHFFYWLGIQLSHRTLVISVAEIK